MQDRPSDPAYAAGWYPDPGGEHDHRYHNGTSWTADVSTDGVRSVQALPDPSNHRHPRSGTVPLALGVVSMSIAWIPFVCFVAVVVAIVAVVLGLRRRSDPVASGAATAGIVTGSVGIVLAVAGIWMSIAIVSAVSRFERPGPNEAIITDCREVDGVTRASGSITNLDTTERSYTITVAFDDEQTGSAGVDGVAPGATVGFVVEEDLRFDVLECRVDEVHGPRPFGLGDEG